MSIYYKKTIFLIICLQLFDNYGIIIIGKCPYAFRFVTFAAAERYKRQINIPLTAEQGDLIYAKKTGY